MNSNHQFGTALDLIPDPDESEPGGRFPVIYSPNPGEENRAATTWCQLAASAHAAGNARQVLVENTRSGKPTDVARVYYTYGANSTLASCIAAVRRHIEGDSMQNIPNCLALRAQMNEPLPPQNRINPNEACSPNHVHAAR